MTLPFRTAMSWSDVTPTTVVCIGSSTTAGTGTLPETNLVSRVARIVHHAHGDTLPGCSYLTDHPGWTTTGSITAVQAGLSQQSRRLAPGATMRRTVAACRAVTVAYRQGSGSGAFRIVVDNGPPVLITPDPTGSAERYDGVHTITGLAPTPHTVSITAEGTATVSGLIAHDATGPRFVNAGRPGSVSHHYSATAAAMRTHNRAIAAMRPSLVVWTLGSNDYTLNVPPAVFKENVRTAVQRLRAACETRHGVLLVHSYRRLDTQAPLHPWESYGQALAEVAAELDDTAYLDASAPWPVSQRADADDLICADAIHLTDRGYAWLARLVADRILYDTTIQSTAGDPVGTDPAGWPGLVAAWRSSDLTQADGTEVAWTPYAGVETSPLTAPTGKAATLMSAAVAGYPAVRTTAAGRYLQTGAWSTTYTGPLTVLAVVKAGSAGVSPYGNLWSGRSGVYAYANTSGDNLLTVGAGTISDTATAYCGHQSWKALGVVYDGLSSVLHTHDSIPVPVPLAVGPSYGLPGFTLGANSGGGSNFVDALYAEVLVFDRALTPGEMTAATSWLARRYHLDGTGRTSI